MKSSEILEQIIYKKQRFAEMNKKQPRYLFISKEYYQIISYDLIFNPLYSIDTETLTDKQYCFGLEICVVDVDGIVEVGGYEEQNN